MTPTTDLLAGLGERGWDAAAGGGWKNTEHDITARQAAPARYEVEHAGRTHVLTTATGALCMIDALIERKTTPAAQ